ncbi:MAG: hypothetical protein ABII26_10820 [Pseudomonadota bacterium]
MNAEPLYIENETFFPIIVLGWTHKKTAFCFYWHTIIKACPELFSSPYYGMGFSIVILSMAMEKA